MLRQLSPEPSMHCGEEAEIGGLKPDLGAGW